MKTTIDRNLNKNSITSFLIRGFLPRIIVLLLLVFVACNNSNPVSPTKIVISFKVTHFFNASHDTVYFGGNPSVDAKVSFIKTTWPSGESDSMSGMNLSWSKDTVYLVEVHTPPSIGIYEFDFRGTISSNGSTFSSTTFDTLR